MMKSMTHDHLSAHHGDFSAFAELMEETHERRFDPIFWATVTHYAPTSVQTIIDLGTGPGLLLLDLARRFTEAQIVGVEAQPEMVKRALERTQGNERLRLCVHDLSQPNIPELDEGKADLVIASMLLHEMQTPTTLIDEISRLLRPGGRVIVYDWIRQPLQSYSHDNRPDTLDQFTHFSEHCRYTAEDIAWLFRKSGFNVVEWIERRCGRFALWVLENKREEKIEE